VFKTAQYPNLEQTYPRQMLLKRFYELEHEYRHILERIAKAADVTAIVPLLQHRTRIVVEAREIVNKMNVPGPHWFSLMQEPNAATIPRNSGLPG
jgi:hypothetical protein